jgi:prepilin signal peptidase PulO-like enzyme (type II secretory pathway)
MAAGKATRKSAIPFGPFITLGFLLVLIVGKL